VGDVCGCREGVGIPVRLPVVVFEPAWFVCRVVGLRVVVGLVRELPVLVRLVSLVFEPSGFVYLLVFELPELVHPAIPGFELVLM